MKHLLRSLGTWCMFVEIPTECYYYYTILYNVELNFKRKKIMISSFYDVMWTTTNERTKMSEKKSESEIKLLACKNKLDLDIVKIKSKQCTRNAV